jgi:hypothetical protein
MEGMAAHPPHETKRYIHAHENMYVQSEYPGVGNRIVALKQYPASLASLKVTEEKE